MLQTRNALFDCHQRLGVSQTIDAISVRQLLRERYLWVDSLSIVQDGEISKWNYINNMGSIYANSSITITG